EALVWGNIKNPNVLPFLGVNKEPFDASFCLISPWINNGDIMSFLRQHPCLNRLQSITDVVHGMAHLHSLEPPIFYADIRGANILVTDDFKCCLPDFGLSLAVEPPSSPSSSNSISGSLPSSSTFIYSIRDTLPPGMSMPLGVPSLKYTLPSSIRPDHKDLVTTRLSQASHRIHTFIAIRRSSMRFSQRAIVRTDHC
ncbi:kinase-like domain-containing protein, partial [Desarmillaria ectypa]